MIQEVNDEDPNCHVCGSQMVQTFYCPSCTAVTYPTASGGYQFADPAPSQQDREVAECTCEDSDYGHYCPVHVEDSRERGQEADPFFKGYKHHEGGAVSDACGDGRHSECWQSWPKCNCSSRGGHNVLHKYLNPKLQAGEAASYRKAPANCEPTAEQEEDAIN